MSKTQGYFKKILFWVVVLAPTFLFAGCIEPKIPSDAAMTDGTETSDGGVPTNVDSGITEAHVFFSGHSLINLNTPTVFAQFAQSQSLGVSYQLQMGLGSTILARLQCPWNGQQADGHAIQYRVQDELIRPNVYDTLVLAENHDIMGSIQYSKSSSMAKVMYDSFTSGNPNGQAYLFENWLYRDNPDLTALLTRIARERSAWDCVASMVNTTRGSRKAMKVLPASTALAALIQQIRAGQVPGVATGESLFTDNVHLNEIGNYYISLLQFAVIYQRSPVGLPYTGLAVISGSPPVLSLATSTRLQEIAWAQAQLAINESSSHLKSQATCTSQMQTLCTDTYGAGTWPCNTNNTTRPSLSISVLNAPVGTESGAWCRTSPAPY